jgi:predicted transcriptional regulator
MQHKGEIVEKAVRESGYSITKLAARLGKSRRWVYDAFQNRNLSIDVILEIGKVIFYDFSNDLLELKRFKVNAQDSAQFTYQVDENSVEYWKNKYLDLLEKYNRMLEGE